MTDDEWSVLGDQLIEQGDPLGELIARRHAEPDLELRAAVLADVPLEVVTVDWQHGVPWRVRFDGTELEFETTLLIAARDVARSPAMRFVHEVALGVGMAHAVLRSLEEATFASQLRVLDANCIGHQPVWGPREWGDAGCAALAARSFARQLATLDLGGHAVGRDGALAIARGPFDALDELRLAGARPGLEGVLALAARGIRELDLHDNQLGDAGCAALAGSATRALRLGMNGITGAGVGALSALTELEALTLFLDDIGDSAIYPLTRMSTLRCLELVNIGLTDGGVLELAMSPLLGQLTELHLGSNPIGDPGVAALAAAPGAARLEVLNLEMLEDLTDDGLEALAQSPYLANLKELWLWSTDCVRGVDALLASPHLSPAVKASLREQHPDHSGR